MIRSALLFAAIAGSLGAGGSVRAACALNFPDAVACFDPDSAAEAWRIVGRDPRALGKDYVRAVLSRAGCVRFSDVADANQPIREAAAARVPAMDGWTPVLFLSVTSQRTGGSAVWLAAAYVDGDCAPMPPVE